MARIKVVKRSTPVRDRLTPWARTTYRCACGTTINVVLMHGVGDGNELFLPEPDVINCPSCDEETCRRGGAHTLVSAEHDRVEHLPYLRVPSIRAAIKQAQEGVAEGQLVYPEDPLEL